jgi:flagellar protein FlaJ
LAWYTKTAFKLFGELSRELAPRLAFLKPHLRKAGLRLSLEEYLSITIFTSFLLFLIEVPVLTLIFALLFPRPLFALLLAVTISTLMTVLLLLFFVHWPSIVILSQAREIDKVLPFASLYLATIAGSRVPLHDVFKIFSKFELYPAVDRETKKLVHDIEVFGYDIDTALKRAIDRTPSKKLGELLWGILATRTAGGDVSEYLKQKSRDFFGEYRRELYEFSRKLTLYIEMYLTAVVVGALFFIILTSIVSGITGVAANVLTIQFLLIIGLLPAIGTVFIWIIKATTPAGE